MADDYNNDDLVYGGGRVGYIQRLKSSLRKPWVS